MLTDAQVDWAVEAVGEGARAVADRYHLAPDEQGA